MKTIQIGKYAIGIEDNQGYFEHDYYGEDDGGSFTIQHGEVYDMEGCYAIPDEVAEGIRQLGYKIDTDEFCI